MKKAIILGHGDAALGVLGALASVDIDCIYLSTSTNRREFSHFSRFPLDFMRAPSPRYESDKLLELLMETDKNWDGALLIPTSDYSVEFVSKNRDRLSTRYVPAVTDWETVGRILNKHSLYVQARQIGVPLPAFILPDNPEALEEYGRHLDYPCILKPSDSSRFYEIFHKKVTIINSFDELMTHYEETRRHNLNVMVSEIIPGEDSRLFHYRSYRDRNGGVLAEMCTQKLRQFPPHFGVARISKTVPLIQEIRQPALALLDQFSYRGISSIEFKRDSRDEQYKLIEINVRPVVPERLFVAAGINFPYIAYRDLIDNVQVTGTQYEAEVYWINLFSDIYEFTRTMGKGKFPVKEYFIPYRKKRKVYCMSLRDDPIPFLVRGTDLIKTISGVAVKRLRPEK
jgi:predicted ATP-grasp superfamily ATP-dependent carboligase